MALDAPDTASRNAEMTKLVKVNWEKPREELVKQAFPVFWREIRRVVEEQSNQTGRHVKYAQTHPPMEEFEALLNIERTWGRKNISSGWIRFSTR
jgi:hypothetical protein